MTNFDFLKNDERFASFAGVAIAAENNLHIDTASCVINCRRAMEFAAKWMYSVDNSLNKPYRDELVNLINNDDFRDIVGNDIWQRMDFIRKMGNDAAHEENALSLEQAELCLENLFVFLDFVAYCYSKDYKEGTFDRSLLTLTPEEALSFVSADKEKIDIKKLIEENEAMKKELTARRTEQQQTYIPKPLELSEYKTRMIYVDSMLSDAGWVKGKDLLCADDFTDMPSDSRIGYADYVLLGDDLRPIALVEAKNTCVDFAQGRQQALLYADTLEQKYERRPVIFLTNGFETHVIDNIYPERKCASVWSKRDLEKLSGLQAKRSSPKNVNINKKIAGRYYQQDAVKAICDAFEQNRRKALLVMATGSGKTRSVIALCDILLRHGRAKNILFLSDRLSLVRQAMRSFVTLLPKLTTANICDDDADYTAQCVFSTYQTMYNVIDSVHDDDGRIFTSGHFDLVICDEAHLSIYKKYQNILNYFDASLVGLTATPKNEINRATYEIFELENGVPTYVYDFDQAVNDGYLVDFTTVETKLKFIGNDGVYDELSDADREVYEKTFESEKRQLPESITRSDYDDWIFDENNIKEALRILMTRGLSINHGRKLGKTIIFAEDHDHAEKILGIFSREYPHLPGFAMVIDENTPDAQSAIDDFSSAQDLPQIAISADMLDTGIDIPEVLNLVFFKRVMSKSKFRQMIGRGTRPCRKLLDGRDKDEFFIFDLCGNFEFFRINGEKPLAGIPAVGSIVFGLKAQIAYKLQDAAYQTDELKDFRSSLVEDMTRRIRELNKDSFAVRQHLKYVELYSEAKNYSTLTSEAVQDIGYELAPLILPDDDIKSLRFDALIYGMELAHLNGDDHGKENGRLYSCIEDIASLTDVPGIIAQKDLIDKILREDYIDDAGIAEFENIRINLRDLIGSET